MPIQSSRSSDTEYSDQEENDPKNEREQEGGPRSRYSAILRELAWQDLVQKEEIESKPPGFWDMRRGKCIKNGKDRNVLRKMRIVKLLIDLKREQLNETLEFRTLMSARRIKKDAEKNLAARITIQDALKREQEEIEKREQAEERLAQSKERLDSMLLAEVARKAEWDRAQRIRQNTLQRADSASPKWPLPKQSLQDIDLSSNTLPRSETASPQWPLPKQPLQDIGFSNTLLSSNGPRIASPTGAKPASKVNFSRKEFVIRIGAPKYKECGGRKSVFTEIFDSPLMPHDSQDAFDPPSTRLENLLTAVATSHGSDPDPLVARALLVAEDGYQPRSWNWRYNPPL